MLNEELRKRISELNRKDIKILQASDLPKKETGGPGVVREPSPREIVRDLPLDKLLNGEVIETPEGEFLRFRRIFSDVVPESDNFLARYSFVFSRGGNVDSLNELHKDLQAFYSAEAAKVVYLDIETCGLTSTPVFLIGLMYYSGNNFILEQLFARDYTEEAPLLIYLEQLFREYNMLVSFNGKTFDYPYLTERGLINGILLNREMPHLDLLHESRRRWKDHLPNCKLSTIERHILKRFRTDDIPGEQIPEAYHDFVRTGRINRVKQIIHHNLFDLISMGELLLWMFVGNFREDFEY